MIVITIFYNYASNKSISYKNEKYIYWPLPSKSMLQEMENKQALCFAKKGKKMGRPVFLKAVTHFGPYNVRCS